MRYKWVFVWTLYASAMAALNSLAINLFSTAIDQPKHPQLASRGLLVAATLLLAVVGAFGLWRVQSAGGGRSTPISLSDLRHQQRLRLGAEISSMGLRSPAPMDVRWRDWQGCRHGTVRTLSQSFPRLSRPLVIVGPAGAGKTVAALELALGLVEQEDSPVPILCSAAGWDPGNETYAELVYRYAAEACAQTCSGLQELVERSLSSGDLVGIIDGIDELSTHARLPAISAIHTVCSGGMSLALTARTDDYSHAIGEATESLSMHLLPRAAVLELQPNRPDDVIDFLAAHRNNVAQWEAFCKDLRRQDLSELWRVLSIPLMTWLAYRSLAGARSAIDLLGMEGDELKNYLLSHFIPHVYNDQDATTRKALRRSSARYDRDQAQRWLTSLALALASDPRPFHWGSLHWTNLSLRSFGVERSGGGEVAALVSALGMGSLFVAGVTSPSIFTVPAAIAYVWVAYKLFEYPTGVQNLGALLVVLGFPVGVLLPGAFLLEDPLLALAEILWLSCILALVLRLEKRTSALVLRLKSMTGYRPAKRTPRRVSDESALRRSLTVLWSTAGAVLVVSAFSAPIGWLFLHLGLSTRPWMSTALIVGVTVGLFAGHLDGTFFMGAIYPYWAARVHSACTRRLPWRLEPFLADARARGVLRETAAGYTFRHDLIQSYLAGPKGRA